MSTPKHLILLLSALLLGCNEAVEEKFPDSQPSDEKRYFISSVARDTIDRSTLELLANGLGQTAYASKLKYDVETYTINYSTTFKEKSVEASGLIMVPVAMPTEAAILSFQHGTTFVKSEAPSVREGFQGTEFLASAGYVTIMPDFLGYGASASIFHPYYDRQHSASAVIDLILATKEFLAAKKVPLNDKLYLAGYSEGGYVTLAAAKEIDSNPAYGLRLTAVAAGAGGYDLPAMLVDVTSNDYYPYPSYLAFILMAYNQTLDWNKPLSYFFAEKYAMALSEHMDGTYSGGFINSRLTTRLPDLFSTTFFAELHNPEGAAELKTALHNNSIDGWKTVVPIRLYHGTKDEIIPSHNSTITLEKFEAAGSKNVSLTLIPGGTHGNSFEPMLRDFIPWLLGM